MSARPELCLTIDVAVASGLPETLAAALKAAPVSSVILRAAGQSAASVQPLIEIAQRTSVTALISDDVALARLVKADGVHLPWSRDAIGAYRTARAALENHVVIGADAGRSRHDAMTLGEAGADYVAFGIPAHVEDRATARRRQIDLIAWWSGIFEVPCVGFDVEDADHAQQLAAAGADFIAIPLQSNLDATSVGPWLATFPRAAAPGKAA